MVIDEIQADIEAIERNAALYEEINFSSRVEAIDYLEFNVIDRIEAINQPDALAGLKREAERVKRRLEEVDERLFQRLRADIRAGGCKGSALKDLIDRYAGGDASESQQPDEIGYDCLDLFINGLLLSRAVPTETKVREPEMVYYQPTPARIILEVVEKAPLTDKDVFYDLGSGLGQVSILVHLLSGVTAKGIEFEPAYSDYAKACAADLNLSGVEFINVDARSADYSDGTIFFMYTPFESRMLQNVLAKLQAEARIRLIWVLTYGPCTPQVARQRWLKVVDSNGTDLYKLGVFKSV